MTPLPGYSLSANSAREVKRLITDRTIDGGTSSNGGTLVESWVKVTGAASGGWYPAVCSQVDDAGTWTDDTVAVEAKASSGSLTSGNRYWAVMCGTTSGGVSRFVVVASTGGTTKTETLLADITCSGGTLVKTYLTITYTDPS